MRQGLATVGPFIQKYPKVRIDRNTHRFSVLLLLFDMTLAKAPAIPLGIITESRCCDSIVISGVARTAIPDDEFESLPAFTREQVRGNSAEATMEVFIHRYLQNTRRPESATFLDHAYSKSMFGTLHNSPGREISNDLLMRAGLSKYSNAIEVDTQHRKLLEILGESNVLWGGLVNPFQLAA